MLRLYDISYSKLKSQPVRMMVILVQQRIRCRLGSLSIHKGLEVKPITSHKSIEHDIVLEKYAVFENTENSL